MRDAGKTIGNLIDKVNVPIISSVDGGYNQNSALCTISFLTAEDRERVQ
jgi:hypothetical protein